MKIGVIGSGVVGQTLAAGFLKHGHEVEIGTREPAKLKEWVAQERREFGSSRSPKPPRSAMSWRSRSRGRQRSRR